MTLDILYEALTMLRDRGDNMDYKQEVIQKSLEELTDLLASLTDHNKGIWYGAVHVVHMADAIDVQNALLYDVYGRLARKAKCNRVLFTDFIDEARKTYGFENASIKYLRSGFEYINDLWYDNEKAGDNNADGTFDNGYVKFKELNWDYINTGGNCMVGIMTAWIPSQNRVLYGLTNEEGCTLATVDYISNDLEIDDYDELMLEYVDWGRVTGREKYFELYRHCLNKYLQSDCKHFGYTKEVPYHLLSDTLQAQVPEGYVEWSQEWLGDIPTDGYKVFISEEFNRDA